MHALQCTLTVVTLAVAVSATPAQYGPFVPLNGYGGSYGLGLGGGMSYGHQYLSSLQHQGYADVPVGYGGFAGPVTVKEPVVRQDALIHGGGAGGGLLHDFQTNPKQGLAPAHAFVGPLTKDGGVHALHGSVHYGQHVHDVGVQRPPLRRSSYKPTAEGLVHGGFRTPLPKDVGLHDSAGVGTFHRQAAPSSPILGPGAEKSLGGFFNRRPLHVASPHHAGFDGPHVGKGSFGLAAGAFGSHGGHKISEPFLTPVTRYSDGYAYHRVPLALVEGGFVGHHFGTPVVHGIVKAGVPVSLARGW